MNGWISALINSRSFIAQTILYYTPVNGIIHNYRSRICFDWFHRLNVKPKTHFLPVLVSGESKKNLYRVCSCDCSCIYEPRSDVHWTWKIKQLSLSLRTVTSSPLGALLRLAHYGTDRKLDLLLILNSAMITRHVSVGNQLYSVAILWARH